jgi:cytochrome c2
MKHALWVTAAAAFSTVAAAAAPDRWTGTAHGPMLERILPKTITPAQLPEPQSQGARLVARYCVQCHHLPNPPMHTAARWKTIVERMVWRMRGDGNLGAVMKDLMDGVQAPTDEEAAALTEYLQRYGQKELDPGHPALFTEAGKMYALACTQCHELPDPQRHTASEWPAVVQRMHGHMLWANTVMGDANLRTTPELNTADIVRLLQRYARPEGTP